MYLNDITNQQSIIRLASENEFLIYANWVKQYNPDIELGLADFKLGHSLEASSCLKYFGFSFDEFIDALFNLLPARSANADSNRELVVKVLLNPEISKNKCCIAAGKNPSHYSRLVQTIEENCNIAASVTGGRNPMVLIRSIRTDF